MGLYCLFYTLLPNACMRFHPVMHPPWGVEALRGPYRWSLLPLALGANCSEGTADLSAARVSLPVVRGRTRYACNCANLFVPLRTAL